MPWPVIDRKTVREEDLGPALSDEVLAKIGTFLPRYATKRAVMLPALHIAQDAIGYVSLRAMRQIAELLELTPAAVMDVVTFYSHFWTRPRGRKVVCVCRSLTCELLGGRKLLDVLKEKLGIDEGATTADGRYSLMTEECLAGCDHGPCMLINEKMHKCVRVEDVERILADPDNDKLAMPRSDLYDPPGHGH